NDGAPVPVVEISTGLSLSVILGVLAVTITASLGSPRGRVQNAVGATRRRAVELIELDRPDPAELARARQALTSSEETLAALVARYPGRTGDLIPLHALVARAHASHGGPSS